MGEPSTAHKRVAVLIGAGSGCGTRNLYAASTRVQSVKSHVLVRHETCFSRRQFANDLNAPLQSELVFTFLESNVPFPGAAVLPSSVRPDLQCDLRRQRDELDQCGAGRGRVCRGDTNVSKPLHQQNDRQPDRVFQQLGESWAKFLSPCG